MRYKVFAAILVCLMPTWIAGCKQKAGDSNASTASGDLKTFPVKGKIVSVDNAKGSILLAHEAIPGFMEAMTMSYKLKDPSVLSELHPGDQILARLLVRKTSDGYEDPMLDEIVVIAQARPDYKPTVQYHVPTQGDAVPDFKLVNENGRTVHLAQFKGKAVLLTFIYTQCPLPDYCPRMSQNFAEIDKALKSDPAAYAKTHLISISFDPKRDTPSVMKQYGKVYAGGDSFDHWEFATIPQDELAKMLEFFGVGLTPGESGTLSHSLSTAVIGADGKIAAWYPSNDWTPSQVLPVLKRAAGV